MENKDNKANVKANEGKKLIEEGEAAEEIIEICFICHKEFDINKDDESYYRHGKYPMCAYCAEFYGFYR